MKIQQPCARIDSRLKLPTGTLIVSGHAEWERRPTTVQEIAAREISFGNGGSEPMIVEQEPEVWISSAGNATEKSHEEKRQGTLGKNERIKDMMEKSRWTRQEWPGQ
jgi:hypothetical protein